LIFVPVIERGSSYSDQGIGAEHWVREPGNAVDTAVNIGAGGQEDPLNGTSWLLAVAPATQRHVWRVRTPGGGAGGVMATGGDLVFQGDILGNFNAYAADSGTKLWSFATGAGIVAAPITYLARSKQFVSVIVGVGTGGALLQLAPHTVDYRTQAKRVLTFGIGGHGKLGPPTPFITPVALPDPDYRPDEKIELQGAITFGGQCTNCHGAQAVSAGNAPDLRASAVPLSEQAFAQVVREGTLLDKGMPRFAEFDDAKLNAVRQYIRSRAEDLRAHPIPAVTN
jgi:quinohemoprotein ethanol dehydrogenase